MTDPGSGTPMSERMQALLSRAVEDQLSEQRQVAGAMTEVRNHLAHLGAELQQLRATAGGAADEEIQRQVAGVAADVREAIRVLSERIDGVASMVHQRGNDLAELRGVIGKDLAELRGVIGNDLAEVRGVIDNELRPRVDGVDAAMRDLRGAFTGIGSRVADLPGRQEIETMLSRPSEVPGPIDERLEQLQGWIEEVHDGLFGETGVHPRVQALVEQAAESPAPVEEDLGGRIDDAVRSAVAASEKRITAHVDEAVLALAEALLRRRSRTGGLGLSAFDTGEIPIVPPAPQEQLDSPQEQLDSGPGSGPALNAGPLGSAEPAAPVAPPTSPASAETEASFSPPQQDGFPTTALPPASAPPTQIDLDPAPASAPAPSAYQPAAVPGPMSDGHDDYGDDDDAARRRHRPWWRPGD
ncbi:MAG TPA: hypothetical protein VFJ17_00155 [Mycobacteriales bacterium]|jgi:hypothetical protein|nr:hypothetical protein [Mycobacteriales bacterium]